MNAQEIIEYIRTSEKKTPVKVYVWEKEPVESGELVKLAQQELDRYFCEMEKETVKEVRNILGSQGYINSGVTLTRITEAEGQVEYVLNIHHERLYQIDDEERQELVEKLDDISAKRGYTFLINFYEIEEV